MFKFWSGFCLSALLIDIAIYTNTRYNVDIVTILLQAFAFIVASVCAFTKKERFK